MGKVRDQINGIPFKSELDRFKVMLGVVQHLNEFTVKGLALDPSSVEKIVRTALRERWNGEMLLTKSIQTLFDVRQLDMATSAVNLPQLKAKLEKRDHSLVGTDAPSDDVKDLTQHLCNELNSLPIEKTKAFLIQVNLTNALDQTTEDWTLAFWKSSFTAYEARTPTGASSVITGFVDWHNKTPRPESAVHAQGLVNIGFAVTESVHTVGSDPLTEELGDMPKGSLAAVVGCLLKGDSAGAYQAVLANRNENQVGRVIPLGKPDLSGLSLVPM